jgi:hypothetical protein
MAALGENLHLAFVLEEPQPLRGEPGLEPRKLRLGDLLLLHGRVQICTRDPGLLVGGEPSPGGREDLAAFQLAAQLAELLGLLRGPFERRGSAAASPTMSEGEGGSAPSTPRLAARLACGAPFRHPGRFLEDRPAVLRPRAHDEPDAALLDDGVRPGADARAEEQLGDVEQPAGGLVDLVAALAGAEEPARDGDLAEARVLRGDEAAVVLEGERHLRHPRGRAGLAAAEDHVFHGAAAQVLRALLAHCPADGVDHVRLAAAVRPDDAGDAVVEGEDHPVGERLEAGDLGRRIFMDGAKISESGSGYKTCLGGRKMGCGSVRRMAVSSRPGP